MEALILIRILAALGAGIVIGLLASRSAALHRRVDGALARFYSHLRARALAMDRGPRDEAITPNEAREAIGLEPVAPPSKYRPVDIPTRIQRGILSRVASAPVRRMDLTDMFRAEIVDLLKKGLIAKTERPDGSDTVYSLTEQGQEMIFAIDRGEV